MNIKQKLISAKDFVVENRGKILGAALVVTTTTAALMIRNKIVADEFLKENDLYEEFYAMSEDE